MSQFVDADKSFVALDADAWRAPAGTPIADLDGLKALYNAAFTQTITGGPTAGTFTLTVSVFGSSPQTTTALAFGADASAIQAAIEALSNVGAGDVAVTGTTVKTITFQGALAGKFISLSGDGSLLTGGTSPAVVVTPVDSLWLPYGGIEAGLTIDTSQDRTPKTIMNKKGVYRRIDGPETKEITFRAVDDSPATLKTRTRGGSLVAVPPASGTTPTGIWKLSDNPTGAGESFAFAMDVRDGAKHFRKYWPEVELTAVPQEVYNGEDLTGYEFKLGPLEHPLLVPAHWQNFDTNVVAA